MTRALDSDVLTEIQNTNVSPFVAVNLAFDSVVANRTRLWGGYGDISFIDSSGSAQTYVGAGDLLSVSKTNENEEVTADNIEIILSGLPSTLIGTVLSDPSVLAWQGNPAEVYLGFLSLTDANNQTIVGGTDGVYQIFGGLLDTADISNSGDTASIKITVESFLLRFNETSGRRYTDNDQKIDFPNDNSLRFVNQLQRKQLYWGRVL